MKRACARTWRFRCVGTAAAAISSAVATDAVVLVCLPCTTTAVTAVAFKCFTRTGVRSQVLRVYVFGVLVENMRLVAAPVRKPTQLHLATRNTMKPTAAPR